MPKTRNYNQEKEAEAYIVHARGNHGGSGFSNQKHEQSHANQQHGQFKFLLEHVLKRYIQTDFKALAGPVSVTLIRTYQPAPPFHPRMSRYRGVEDRP